MQAYKLKGKIDQSGHLIITEPSNLIPGDVEVIILQEVENVADAANPKTDSQFEPTGNTFQSRTNALKDLLANSKPVPADFDPEQARWEALQEKYL